MGDVVPLYRWEMYDFEWGTAVRDRLTQRWTHVFLAPDAQEVCVEHLDVVLHENGIEIRGIRQEG